MSSSIRSYLAAFLKPENPWLHVLTIVILGWLCYGNTFSVPFYFDDYGELLNDPAITDGNLWDIVVNGGARRFADVSFAINYKIHGVQVAGYHLVNIFIHILSAIAVYFLCSATINALGLNFSGNRPEGYEPTQAACRFIPLATSLIFISHPLQTQAVTYIIQRYTSLVGCLYIVTMLAYLKGRICLELQGRGRTVTLWWCLGAVGAVLGVYTKQSFFSLPLMILLFEQGAFRGRFVKKLLLSFAVIAAAVIGVKALPVLFNGGTVSELMYKLHDATSEDFSSTRTEYFLTQLRVIVTYLRLVILPIGQRLDYDYPEFSTLLNLEVFASAVLHLILVSLAVVLYLRTRNQPAAASEPYRLPQRLIAIGIAWFYIALSVTSSIIPIPDDIAEHRMYLPSAGLFLALAAVVQLAALKFGNVLRYRKIGLAMVCLILALVTIARNHVWGDELHFWQNEVSLSPNNGLAYGNLGFAYLRQDNNELALRTFAKALKLDPSLQQVWIALGAALQGLNLYQGRFTTGEEHLTPEGDIDSLNNRLFYGSAFNVLGLTNEFIGQPGDALIWYNKSLTLNPKAETTWYNFGLLSLQLGNKNQTDMAIRKLRELDSLLADTLASRTM